MKRRIGLAALVAAALLVLTQALIPPTVAAGISRAARSSFPDGKVEVAVHALPALQMLWGNFDRLEFECKDLQAGDAVIDSLRVEVNHAALDMRRLLDSGELALKRQESFTTSLVLGPEYINSYLVRNYRGYVGAPEVEIEGSEVLLKGTFSLFDRELPVALRGNLEPGGDLGVEFVPRGVEVAGTELTPSLERRLKQEIYFSLPRDNFPFSGAVTGADARDGRVEITVQSGRV